MRQTKRVLIVQSVGGGRKPWWFQHMNHLADSLEIEFVREPRPESDGLNFFKRTLQLYFRLNSYDIVVTFQDGFATFVFAFINRLRVKKPCKHIVLELITRERERMPNARGWLKYRFLRFALQSVDCFTCSAREEISYYANALGISAHVFRFVPLAADPAWLQHPTSDGAYIVSAGRTGRDYATFLQSVRNLPIDVRIVAGKGALEGLSVPSNVRTYYDVPLSEFMDLLANAKFVVIPLENREISVGQTVILQAMALGKGLIATDIGATRDYVEHDVNAKLVPPEDVLSLRDAIEELNNDVNKRKSLGSAARRVVSERYLPQHTWHTIIESIETAAQS